MAMTVSGMSSAIQSAIEEQLGSPDDPSQLQKFCDAIAQGIVDYIQENAAVLVTAVQPGSGTATGTVE